VDHSTLTQMMVTMIKNKTMVKKEKNQWIKTNHQIQDHQNMVAAQMMILNQLNLKNKTKWSMMNLYGPLINKKDLNHSLDLPEAELKSHA